MTKFYGIQGTAIAFTARLIFSGFIILILIRKIISPIGELNRRPLYFLAFGVVSFALVLLVENIMARAGLWLAILSIFTLGMWTLIFKKEDRELLLSKLRWSQR